MYISVCVCLREFCTQVIHIDALSLLFLGFGVFACYFRVLVFARFAVLLYFFAIVLCVFMLVCTELHHHLLTNAASRATSWAI